MTMQIPLSDWPLGLEEDALVLSLLPAEIERRSRIRFTKDRDELDEFEGAILNLGDGRTLALQYYPNSPVRGTNVIRRAGDDEALVALMDLLELEREEIAWKAPNIGRIRKSASRKSSKGAIAAAIGSVAVAALQLAVLRRSGKSSRSASRRKKTGNSRLNV